MGIYRVYISNYNNSLETLQIVNEIREADVHVVLAFARDYDHRGVQTKGTFQPYFNTTQLSPLVIKEFKDTWPTAKFILSIGGRSADYAFAVNSTEKEEWVNRALDSLKNIIAYYKFDGIDVYYEHIKSDQFASAITDVISRLKNQDIIKTASLTVSASALNEYNGLYMKSKIFIDNVVYQTHTKRDPSNSVDDLLRGFANLALYPKGRLLAGHSSISKADVSSVPLRVFHEAIPKLLQDDGPVSGISKWIVTANDDPEK